MDNPVLDVPDDWSVGTVLDDGIAIVSVAGEVDMSTAPELAAELADQVAKRPDAVVVDLGRISFFGSSAINVLLDAHERSASRGVPLLLAAPAPGVVRSLEIVGLSEVFPRHETVSEAIGVLRGAGRAPMRIAVVSEHASPLTDDLGQGTHVAQLSAALQDLGNEVVVYTRRDDEAAPERIHTAAGYDVVHVPAGPARKLSENEVVPHLGEFAEFLERRWRPCPPDVVHAHHWTSGLAAVIGTRRCRVPVVHSCDAGGTGDHQPRADAERLVARRASWIMAPSPPEASALRRLGVRRDRISVVPSGVDVDHFQPDGPAAGRGRPHRLVTVGDLLPCNGFTDVIAALSAVEDAELVIAGRILDGGGFADELRRLAGELGVLDRVVFAGEVPGARLPALLRSADVVVCAPWSDPFGVVALAAMACGVPVVATAVGALEDVVVHDITGLHVPPREPRVLARSLRRLLGDRTLREELGTAARDRVLARHSRDRLGKEALAVYQHVGRVLTGQDTG
jgi:D-inositol-3-phosphate glycosyltransferase